METKGVLLAIIAALITVFSIVSIFHQNKINQCESELDQLYLQKFDLQHASTIAYSDKIWFYVLSDIELDEPLETQNLEFVERYKENGRNRRDEGWELQTKISTLERKQIIPKKEQCRQMSLKTNIWNKIILVLALVELLIAVIPFKK